MKPIDDIKAFYRNAAINTNRAGDKVVLTDALQAGGLKTEKRAAHPEPSLWRAIMKSRTTKLAAAAVVVAAVIISLTRFNEPVVKAVEFSEITQAMEDVPWMFASAQTYGSSMTGMMEVWIGFETKVLAGTMPDGKVSYCRFKEHEKAEYDPNANTITLSYAREDEFLSAMSSPVQMLESMHKILEDQGAEVVAQMGQYQGRKVQVQEIALAKSSEGGARYAVTLYIDPRSKLLHAAEATAFDANGVAVSTAGVAYDYPKTGPQDIYDLGVPRDAHIVDNMPPSQFRAVWEQYQQIRKKATDEYIAIITHCRSDGDDIVTMIDVGFKSGRKHRQERHSVFHRGETPRQLWPTYKEQLGDTFASLLAWSQGHYDDARAGISIHLYDGEYNCSVEHRAEQGWGLFDKGYSPDHDPGQLRSLGHLAWPGISSTARIVEDDYARQNGLICIESLGQGHVDRSGWPLLPSRWLRYLDPSRDYMCVRQVTEWCPDAEWQEDKDWLAAVDPDKMRHGSIEVADITEIVQAPNGHWYPRVIVEKTTGQRKDYRDAPLKAGSVKTIYLETSPTFPEGIFDIDRLPGQ